MGGHSTSQYRKKLIEVSIPLEAINKESAYEKSLKQGHPSSIHIWWSRKPLSSCRAIIFSSLVDDPSSWPDYFPTDKEQEIERKRLFTIIEDLVKWENFKNDTVITKALIEIAKSLARSRGEELPDTIESVKDYISKNAPALLDPFCGGGSIPLESYRLNLNTLGSDLNPVAVLVSKALVELPPIFFNVMPINQKSNVDLNLKQKQKEILGLSADIRYYGEWICQEAEKRIGHLFPKILINEEILNKQPNLHQYLGQELTVIAWIWARTVASPDPCLNKIHTPLIHSYWLSTKKGKEVWIDPIVNQESASYDFIIRLGNPKNGFDPSLGTISRLGAKCLFSNQHIPFEYIREEGKSGRFGKRLIAIVAQGNRERVYINSQLYHEKIANSAIPVNYPITDIPQQALGFRVQRYGLDQHWKLFTNRQLVALTTFSDLINEARTQAIIDAKKSVEVQNGLSNDFDKSRIIEYANAIAVYLALALSKMANHSSALAPWMFSSQCPGHVFCRHAIAMNWDFSETNVLNGLSGSFASMLESTVVGLEMGAYKSSCEAKITQEDAQNLHNIGNNLMICTDPPYYDNIGYADLSDFFYIWLRRTLESIYPDIFSTLLSPKNNELISSSARHGGDKQKAINFFENGIQATFARIREIQNPEYPMTIFYAYKQIEVSSEFQSGNNKIVSTGWETLLNGLISSKFTIEATWPMRTEWSGRTRGINSNALASSIVLVCRPRPADAPIATRREFMAALKRDLPRAMRHLQQGNIAPVDLAQASIGPGMAVFTRYAKVLESDGSAMSVRTALGIINQVLDEVLAEQEGEFDPDTRWAVAWFEQFGMSEGPYGEAETLSKAKNVSVNGLVEAGVLAAKAGKVHILSRDELYEDWDPATDTRLTVWETTQHLIRQLDKNGESGAAALLGRLGSNLGSKARDLAYRLYAVCERKKWATEALAYNSLIISWPEIERLARGGNSSVDDTGQTRLV